MSAPQFKVKKRVTLPVLQLKPGGGERFFKIMTPMKLGEKLDDQKGAAMLFEAVDLVSGEYGNVIPPTIMQNELNKHYPNDSYVGKCFQVSVTRNAAKKYNHVSLAEVDESADEAADASEGGDEPVSASDAAPSGAATVDEAGQAADAARADAETVAPAASRSRRR